MPAGASADDGERKRRRTLEPEVLARPVSYSHGSLSSAALRSQEKPLPYMLTCRSVASLNRSHRNHPSATTSQPQAVKHTNSTDPTRRACGPSTQATFTEINDIRITKIEPLVSPQSLIEVRVCGHRDSSHFFYTLCANLGKSGMHMLEHAHSTFVCVWPASTSAWKAFIFHV